MKKNEFRWRSWLGAAAAATLSACAGGEGSGNYPDTPSVVDRSTLTAFKGANACTDLESYLEDTAVRMMRTQLESQRDNVPSWGWWDIGFGGRGFAEGDASNAAAGPQAAGASGGKTAEPGSHTTTNNQVQGVDEADFVKNDGTRIFVLSGNMLYASKSWPAEELSLAGKLKIEGYPREMFLDGKNTAVVFSSVWNSYPLQPDLGFACDELRCGYYYSNTTKVTVVDVTDLSKPFVKNEYYLPGGYTSARKIDSSVRVVLTDAFRFPQSVKFWPDWEDGLWRPENKDRLRAKYDSMIVENEKLIRGMKLSDWLPPGRARINGSVVTMPQDCGSFSKVNAPTRLGTLTVATLNLQKPEQLDRTSILAESGQVYASAKNLYVATQHWWWWPRPGQKDVTYVHKFDISHADAARYVASGTIDGHIVDQFSLDENSKGFFRMATTITTRVVDPKQPNNWWGTIETTNRVQVTRENAGVLEVVGQSEELAKGERIMSSRFIEDKGYVVTFRQVDPLYTFDLKDPANPKKVGELKIPGFSSYIHPLDENHLLTIGTFVPENNTDWRLRALQLSIFDVSDLANPKQSHTIHVGTSSSYSEAQHEHKAFNYFGAKKTLAIPFTDWSYNHSNGNYWDYFVSDLRVFKVDPVTGFTAAGAISMADMYKVYNYYNWSYYWTPRVRRSVMADDYVYAISDSGIRSAKMGALNQPLATVRFDKYSEQ